MLYRKKQVVVEVIKFEKVIWEASIREAKLCPGFPMVLLDVSGGWRPVIETLEGNMVVSDGDYIIKGVKGEYYPCKPDIFHETYEKVKNRGGTIMLNLDEKGFSEDRKQQAEFIHHNASGYGKERYIKLNYSGIEEELSKRLESYSTKLKEAIEEEQKVAKEEDLLIRGAGNEVARGLDKGELELNYYGMLDTKSTQKVINTLRKDFDIRAVGNGSVALRGSLYTVVIEELVNSYFIEEALSNSFFYYIGKVLSLIEEAQVMHAKKDTLDERVEEIQDFMKATGIVFAPHLVSTSIDSPIEVEVIESAYVVYKDIQGLHEDIQEIADNYLNTVKRNKEGNNDLERVLNLLKAKEGNNNDL